MIYQWEASKDSPDQVSGAYWGGLATELGGKTEAEDAFANRLLHGVARNVESLDRLIVEHAEHWKLERMSAVDRNILRLGAYEMRDEGTAAAVAIDEAVDLGRRFSGEASAKFVNGVLDAIRKSLEEKPAEAKP